MENVKLMRQMQVSTRLNIPLICTDVLYFKKGYYIYVSKTLLKIPKSNSYWSYVFQIHVNLKTECFINPISLLTFLRVFRTRVHPLFLVWQNGLG
jgi:hypothetical protein